MNFFAATIMTMTFFSNVGLSSPVLANDACEDHINWEYKVAQESSSGRWFWQGNDGVKIYQDSVKCVDNEFEPSSQTELFLPKLERLNHFGSSINYGVEIIRLPKLTSVRELLISSASYPNSDVKKVDFSSLTTGTLFLLAGNAAPNLEEIIINKSYWHHEFSSDQKSQIEKLFRLEETEESKVLTFRRK